MVAVYSCKRHIDECCCRLVLRTGGFHRMIKGYFRTHWEGRVLGD